MSRTGTVAALFVSAWASAHADLSVRPAASVPLALPEEGAAQLTATDPAEWVRAGRLRLVIAVPADAPAAIQTLVVVHDWDSLPFQRLVAVPLAPGATNALDIDVGPYAEGWEPLGHPGAWHRRSLLRPEEVAVRFFDFADAYTGAVEIVRAELVPLADDTPPAFRNVRTTESTPARPAVDGRFELRFDLPDRYANPFDPDEIAVDAEIATPSGATVSVPCFYYQECVRERTATTERVLPQGRPEWRLRYAPSEEGPHTVALVARDRFGETRLDGAAAFDAAPPAPDALRAVHVSTRDPRYFADDAGRAFFPIGYNIRSPHDVRMDQRFPDPARHPEGSLSYARRFAAMGRAGMTFAEVWSASWSLGLEWSPRKRGYHGVGQYHLANAWERDRVFEMAAANGIRISLVLNNHGRLSAFSDAEWADNPYNAKTFPDTGLFESPEAFFTDERALSSYEKQLRYEIARYSWNANLFAWQLWSELDLCGATHDFHAARNPAVIAWHRRMAAYLHDHDPKRHLVSTHTSGTYANMPPGLASIPELDHICVDAYHHDDNPLKIRSLMHETRAQKHFGGKPVLITEFGGAWYGASIEHLRREVHAALWNALPSGLAGSPMCWWWHMIEEFDFHPAYAAFARFVAGEDVPDPAMRTFPADKHAVPPPKPAPDAPAPAPVALDLILAPERGYAWIHAEGMRYATLDPAGDPVHAGYKLRIPAPDLDGRIYTFEFWDTLRGEPVRLIDARVRDGAAEATIPPFARDIAAKIRLRP